MATATAKRGVRLSPTERRRQLLEVARALFATQPYQELTIAAVAREAGVTRALVHHYFGSVRDLYLVLLGELGGEAIEIPGAIEGLGREERVARNVDAWLELTEANRETFMAIAGHGVAIPDPEVMKVVEAGRELAITRIIEANSDLISETPATRLALRGLLTVHQALCTEWFEGGATRAQVQTLLTRMFLDLVERTIPQLEAESG